LTPTAVDLNFWVSTAGGAPSIHERFRSTCHLASPWMLGTIPQWKQAFYSRDLAGTVVLVGVPSPDIRIEMPLVDLFSHGGSLKRKRLGSPASDRSSLTFRIPLFDNSSTAWGFDLRRVA
jgi:Zn-dependent alcohol dehydrogenase